MTGGRGQVETAILIISVTYHGAASAAVLMVLREVLVRAFRKKAIDGAGAF
jgi:hypothetical protein